MKVINKQGKDVTNEFKEIIEKVKKSLNFYYEGNHYHWDGCRCHGQNMIDDTGGEAESGLEQLMKLEDIDEGIL